MTGLQLPSRRPKGRNWVNCVADGCESWGKAKPHWDAGAVWPDPPDGWTAIDGTGFMPGDGRVILTRVFVCSRACQRRLAGRYVGPTFGSLD